MMITNETNLNQRPNDVNVFNYKFNNERNPYRTASYKRHLSILNGLNYVLKLVQSQYILVTNNKTSSL